MARIENLGRSRGPPTFVVIASLPPVDGMQPGDTLMQANPYAPQPQDDTKQLSALQTNALMKRISVFGLVIGLAAFVIGITWLKLLRRSAIAARDIPFYYTSAELIAWAGMAIAMVIVAVTAVSHLVKRYAPQDAAHNTSVVYSWNVLPATFSILCGIVWCGLGLLGSYSLIAELKNWEYMRGIPLLELVLQSLLYGSGLAASYLCLIAASQWMRKNYARALVYTGVGVLSPIVAAAVLFGVCEELIRYLV